MRKVFALLSLGLVSSAAVAQATLVPITASGTECDTAQTAHSLRATLRPRRGAKIVRLHQHGGTPSRGLPQSTSMEAT